ncbi:MAG: tRNA uridine-5-carboxymethylaminomethyl(34) synthesis GTPase MnmE [Chitinophagaceae bacterium]|nr:tRNA uridine-5-carboxymethylaminomethyl(34) synthesis GTPase MnmE [Chitinophagaceae bacterium]
MLNKLTGWDDTIVALATPPGVGAIGVIRLSGEKSIEITNKLFSSKDLLLQPSHTLHVGFLKKSDNKNTQEEKLLDEVVVSIYKKPTSYTGENVIEISCHGSMYVQQQIIDAVIKEGARLAKPGEFTQRAFLNGKLDLTQAEAVGDLIASNTAASQKAALYNIRGGFSNILKELREKLIIFSSLIELELDFSEEDVEFADRSKFITLINEISSSINSLISSFALGNVIKNGVTVAIVGKPNAGKSTLLNTMLNEDRALVSEIAGTTRDTIEEVLNIKGILFRLIDTAGIREHTGDVIENMGITRSLEKMESADIIIYLFDVINTSTAELKIICDEFDLSKKKYILAGNKSDMLTHEAREKKFHDHERIIFISATQQTGIEILRDQLFSAVASDQLLSESAVITNARHYAALLQVKDSLDDVKNGITNNISSELLALEIRRCLQFIGEITGEITNEDRLDYIFSKFCIGK